MAGRLLVVGCWAAAAGLACCCLAAAVSRAAAPAPQTQAGLEALQREEMEVADRLVKDFPLSAAAMNLLGIVYNSRGNSAAAIKCWQRCLELNPGQADAYDAMGWTALLKGDHRQAVALWHKALAISPRMPGVRIRLARALMNMGRPKEAAAAVEQELEIARSSEGYSLLGQAYLQLQDYSQARKSYEAALSIRSDLPEAYYGLATVCARLGEKAKSADYMRKFHELKTAALDARIQRINTSEDLALLRRSVAQTRTDVGRVYAHNGFLLKAEEHWRRAAELDGKNTQCRLEMASLCQQQGQVEAALRLCEELREIEPDNALNYLRIGALQERLKRPEAAAAAYRKVVELAPRRTEGYRALIPLALHSKSNAAEAKGLAQRLAKLQPSAEHYALLSQACAQSGDRAGALAAIREAAKLEPGSERYRKARLQLEGNQ